MTDSHYALAVVQAEIAKLRNTYLARLPEEFAELQALAAGLESDEKCREAIESLHQRLHKLAGSGGTFGLAKLSRQARNLEQTVKQWLAGRITAVAWSELLGFMSGIASLPDSLQEIEPLASSKHSEVEPALAGDHPDRIWLVEDDTLLGNELARLLGQFGYEAKLFDRLADAEAAAASDRPDVLIMDVLLAAEGLNTTEHVEAWPVLRGLGCPLFFISAHADFATRIAAARLGAQGFLEKPLDVPHLVDRLEMVFERRQVTPFRVMIVDDDEILAEHYRMILLRAGMEVSILTQAELLLDEMARFRPEMLLLDLNMPEYAGPELAAVIRQHDEWVGLPVVYLSAETDMDRQIEALSRGADDFLTKPISDAQLVASVRNRIGRFRQLSDLIAKDSLTGLLKHARIKEELAIGLVRAQRKGKPLSVAMLDIDHFKSVNDTYGHAVGDQVIKAVAHLLRQRLRKSDSIGRYGGEEFAVVLPDCDGPTALKILDDIRTRFAALRFRHDGLEFACNLSAGIACSDDHDIAGGGSLLVAADDALYAAKRGGRNQVRLGSAAAG